MRRLALRHPRFGYRRIAVLLGVEGWTVNRKRVQRLMRETQLQVPSRPRKRRRLQARGVDGIAVHQPRHVNHVWSYDFVFDRTTDGRPLKMLTVLDEYTRCCLGIRVGRYLGHRDVIAQLHEAIQQHGVPRYVRSDNGAEFVARKIRRWLEESGIASLTIDPGSPWQNGYIESFHARLRDELLAGVEFDTVKQAQQLVNQWRRFYNHRRPHSAVGNVPPATFAQAQATPGSAPLRLACPEPQPSQCA